jgi:hypothetical protein
LVGVCIRIRGCNWGPAVLTFGMELFCPWRPVGFL